MKSGIYIITCLLDNKHYIGKSVDWKSRLSGHISQLKYNKHGNPHLQRAFNKYGIENFTFELLEEWDEQFLFSMENWWVNMLLTNDRKYGYNISCTNPFGKHIVSEETKNKISIGNKGKKRSQEFKDNISILHIGRKHSEESKQKRSKKVKGVPRNQEVRDKISNSSKGKKMSEKAVQNMKNSHKNPIVQLDLNNNFIKEWDSARQIGKILEMEHVYISRVIKNKTYIKYDFKWIKLQDYLENINQFEVIKTEGMNYITILTKRDSIQGKLNEYSEKGYKLHTCIKQEDKFTYLLIFEKI